VEKLSTWAGANPGLCQGGQDIHDIVVCGVALSHPIN